MHPILFRRPRSREFTSKAKRPALRVESGEAPSGRRSVLGRPRALTLAQVSRVLAWHDNRITLRQLAAELGVSTTTLTKVIKMRGDHYKQAPPEERATTLIEHRERRLRLRAANLL